ncbi:LytTR family transcriptional regulator DNA-binding domain-containing protein [Paenibacillus sp. UMB4589-SE434]|uniref:LytTR family transcriptional regulator DNA-binding domain-containing protein n=1 Tax=Paenibacillus sp. UMB4589-SE434 TaxID=3046314 RepID=UPI00254E4804|nr:LytTR family transcriptional regulator DNA-binding domain-containing protein [Paenibacillus sp. UMB4589-SE434]MDK8181474.1 LytTR family transcriptional regulator DNA-binding domain-containing protein [Paenibacillus sp. UMB4589-SE434]
MSASKQVHTTAASHDFSSLQITKLQVTKGNSTLLDPLTLHIEPGQCAAIQCNHAMGQLLIDVLLGVQQPSSGSATWNNQPLVSHKQLQPYVGCVRQHDPVYERLSSRQALLFFMKLFGHRDKERVNRMLKIVGLQDKQNVPLFKLTASEQRRFHLARAAIHAPRLILIEDPEFQLDMESCFILRHWLAALIEEGAAVLMTVPALESAMSLTSFITRWTPAGFKQVVLEHDTQADANTSSEVALSAELPEEIASHGEIPAASHSDQEHTNKPRADNEEPPSLEEAVRLQTEAPNTKANASLMANDMMAGTGEPESEQPQEEAEETSQQEIKYIPPIMLDKIPARIQDKIVLIDPLEINFVESQDGLSHLHIQHETYPSSMTLLQLEQKLKAFGFFRCHRSYLVNLQRVREVIIWSRNSYSLVLDDEQKSKIPLSKSKYEEMKLILGIS